MNQEHLSDEQVNMLIHTPLATTPTSDGIRIVRAGGETDEASYG